MTTTTLAYATTTPSQRAQILLDYLEQENHRLHKAIKANEEAQEHAAQIIRQTR